MSKLQPTLYLSFEVTRVLAEMEKDGIKIDRQALNKVKHEYTLEANELEKYLNEERIQLDERLLRNFYINKGYYQVEVSNTYAKYLDDNSFVRLKIF